MKKLLISALLSLGALHATGAQAQENVTWRQVLQTNESISRGWLSNSLNNLYQVKFDGEGALSVTRKATATAAAVTIWSSPPGGLHAMVGWDTSLALYDALSYIAWTSSPSRPADPYGPYLALHDNGSLAVISRATGTVWETPADTPATVAVRPCARNFYNMCVSQNGTTYSTHVLACNAAHARLITYDAGAMTYPGACQ